MAEDDLPELERRKLQRSLERAPLAAPAPGAARYNGVGGDRRRGRRPLVLGFSGGLLAAFLLLTMSTGSASPLAWAASAGGSISRIEAGPLRWLPTEKPSAGPQQSPDENAIAVVTASPTPQPTRSPRSPGITAAARPTPAGDHSGDDGDDLPSPSPTPIKKPSPAPPAAGSLAASPTPAVLGQDIMVSGGGWAAGSRLVLTLTQGSTTDELSGSIDVSSAGQIGWKGGVAGEFAPGTATLKACYENSTTCMQISLNLVQENN